VPDGIVDEVTQHPAQRRRIAVDPSGGHPATVHISHYGAAQAVDLGEQEVVDVHRASPQLRSMLVGLSEQQQVVGESSQG
jgi:hypothetical protein